MILFPFKSWFLKKSKLVNNKTRCNFMLVTTITLFIIVVKMLWVFDAPGPSVFNDELLYRLNASAIFNMSAYVSSQYPPLYPLMLAPAFVFEDWFRGMLLLNVFWSSLIVPATYLLARTLQFSSPIVPTILSALLPMHVIYSRHIMSENLFVPLFIFSFALSLRGCKRHSLMAICFGSVLALTHLTKYLFLPAVPLFFLFWIFNGIASQNKAPLQAVKELIKPFSLAVISYSLIIIIWVIYASNSGFDLFKMFGLGISGIKTDSGGIESLIMWVVLYLAYTLLAWFPMWVIICYWFSKYSLMEFKNYFSLCQKSFIVFSSLLILFYLLLSIQHSFGSNYNYPDPQYILGRYLIHLTPIFLVMGMLFLEKTNFNSMKSFFKRFRFIIFILLPFFCFSWFVLFEGAIWSLPSWFAKLHINSVGVGELSSLLLFLTVLFLSIFVPFVNFIAPKEKLIILSLPVVFSTIIILISSSYSMANYQSPRHAAELAKAVSILKEEHTGLNIYLDWPHISKNYVNRSLEFYGINLKSIGDVESSDDPSLEISRMINLDTLLLTRRKLPIEGITYYKVNNIYFYIYLINNNSIEIIRPKVEKYGPSYAIAGSKFNIQPSGNSAMWFKLESASRETFLMFDNIKTNLTFGENLNVSAIIPDDYLVVPRFATLKFVDPVTGLESSKIQFHIKHSDTLIE